MKMEKIQKIALKAGKKLLYLIYCNKFFHLVRPYSLQQGTVEDRLLTMLWQKFVVNV
jgi:hypothetical protein